MSRADRRIGMVAHDAGGARVLLPVAQELLARGRDVVTYAAGPAIKVLAAVPGVRSIDDAASLHEVAAEFRRAGIGTVVSASGLYNQIEHTARLAARQSGLPVIAVQDAWFNHDQRYQRNGSGSLPDAICVMDERSRDEIAQLGLHADRVVLTGHPGLEDTLRQCRSLRAADVPARRRALGLRDDGIVAAFFSDPFYVGPNRQYYSGPGAIMRPDGTGLYGYTVEEVLPALLTELESASRQARATVDVVIRRHPSECDEVLREIVTGFDGEWVQARLEDSGTTVDWLQVADVVLGMMTIALLEGALAGKPAVSIEFGLEESGQSDPCMAATLGYAAQVLHPRELPGTCMALARREWDTLRSRPAEPLLVEGAAGRVADCVAWIERAR